MPSTPASPFCPGEPEGPCTPASPERESMNQPHLSSCTCRMKLYIERRRSSDYTYQADHQCHALLQALGAQVLLFHPVCLADLCNKHRNKNLHVNSASSGTKIE